MTPEEEEEALKYDTEGPVSLKRTRVPSDNNTPSKSKVQKAEPVEAAQIDEPKSSNPDDSVRVGSLMSVLSGYDISFRPLLSLLAPTCRLYSQTFYQAHRHTFFGSIAYDMMAESNFLPPSKCTLALAQLMVPENVPDSAFKALLAVYDRKIKIRGRQGTSIMLRMLDKCCAENVDIFQRRNFLLGYYSNLSNEPMTLHRLLIIIAFYSTNLELLVELFRTFPSKTARVFNRHFEGNTEYEVIELGTRVLAGLYDADLDAFKEIARNGSTLNDLKPVWLRVLSSKDFKGTYLRECDSILGDDRDAGFLLDVDTRNMTADEKRTIWNRNEELFESLFPATYFYSENDRFLFRALNDWKFGDQRVEVAFKGRSLPENAFTSFCPEFAKIAVQTKHYNLLASNFRIAFKKEYKSVDVADLETRRLSRTVPLFKEFMEATEHSTILSDTPIRHPDGFEAYLSIYNASSLGKILQNFALSPLERLGLVIKYGTDIEQFSKALQLYAITMDVVPEPGDAGKARYGSRQCDDFMSLLNELIFYRAQDADFIAWFNELMANFDIRSITSNAHVDFSLCKLEDMFEVLKRLSKEASINIIDFVTYFNEKEMFEGCIHTDKHLLTFLKWPILSESITNKHPTASQTTELMLRCETSTEAGRLIAISSCCERVVEEHEDGKWQLNCRSHLEGIEMDCDLLGKYADADYRIATVAPTLEFWANYNRSFLPLYRSYLSQVYEDLIVEEDILVVKPYHYHLHCPVEWQRALESYKQWVRRYS